MTEKLKNSIIKDSFSALAQECADRETLISLTNFKMNTMSSIWATWIGLIVTVLGLFHVSYIVSSDQLATLVNAVLQIVGVVVAVVGQFKTHQLVASLPASD